MRSLRWLTHHGVHIGAAVPHVHQGRKGRRLAAQAVHQVEHQSRARAQAAVVSVEGEQHAHDGVARSRSGARRRRAAARPPSTKSSPCPIVGLDAHGAPVHAGRALGLRMQDPAAIGKAGRIRGRASCRAGRRTASPRSMGPTSARPVSVAVHAGKPPDPARRPARTGWRMFDVATALRPPQRGERRPSGAHKKGRPKAAFADATTALRQQRDQKL